MTRQNVPFRLCAGEPGGSASAQNELLLRACLSFLEKPQLDEPDPVVQELRRLELKVDLLMGALQSQLAQDVPQAMPITLSVSAVYWANTDSPETTANPGTAEIYLSPLVAVPLRLAGALAPEKNGDGYRCFRFARLDPIETELMERLLFTYHRREIASSRA